MASFEEREKGFEAKYKNDQDKLFKITARRNKLLGLWAAGQMGLKGADAEAYAKDVVVADFQKPGSEDVVEKILADFKVRGITMEAHKVRHEMQKLALEAEAQINAG
ncbi:MAG: DUF1476 domain-containing protein [Alphaproteobacteria bacterium]